MTVDLLGKRAMPIGSSNMQMTWSIYNSGPRLTLLTAFYPLSQLCFIRSDNIRCFADISAAPRLLESL